MKKNYRELFSLEGKTVLITGSSRGIGLEIARAFYQNKSNVYLLGRSKKCSELTLNKNYYQCDLNNSNKFKLICKKIKNENKKIDVLVNCVGITGSLKKKDNIYNIFKTNLFSIHDACDIYKNFVNTKIGASIINIGSIGSKIGFPGNPGYVSSKFALLGLSKSLAIDLQKKNIRVNSILPGYIKTKMTVKSFENKKENKKRKDRTILNRWGNTSDIVGAAIFLSTEASAYMTGSEIVVDGGWLAKGL